MVVRQVQWTQDSLALWRPKCWASTQTEGGLATVKLPDALVPGEVKEKPTLFGYDFCYVNLPSISVPHTAEHLQSRWVALEAMGLPLNLMSQSFVAFEISRLFIYRYLPAAPSWVSLPQLVSLVSTIEGSGRVSGFEGRLREWVKRLRSEAKAAQSALTDPRIFFERVGQLEVSLASLLGEFRVIERLAIRGNRLTLQPSGAEFVLDGEKPLKKVEVKVRLKPVPSSLWRSVLDNQPAIHSLVNPQGFLVALALLLVDKFRESFDEQRCDLLFEDVSHTFLGWLFPVSAHFWGNPLSLDSAIGEGLEAVSRGEQAVVAYSFTIGPTGRVHGLSLTRRHVEDLVEGGKQVLNQLLQDKPDAKVLLDLLSRLMGGEELENLPNSK